MSEIDLRQLDLNLLVTFEALMSDRNVTRAAARLGRTQSAVSHSLSRLREQLGDPLLVKHGGRMNPSPFAERLIEDVRPILRSLQRVLAPPVPFDAAKTTRTFRIALADSLPSLFPRIVAKVSREAPGAMLEWLPMSSQTLLATAAGQVDLACGAAAWTLPEGLAGEVVGNVTEWATFVRRGHPAIASWGVAEWSRWPHVVVQADNPLPNPVAAAAAAKQRKRRIGARVPNVAAVGPLVARTDLLASLPLETMHEAARMYDLQALRFPFDYGPFVLRFSWCARLTNEPANRWIRSVAVACFDEVLAECEPYVAALRAPTRSRKARLASAAASAAPARAVAAPGRNLR